MASDRIERIKKARSLNDVLSVIDDIEFEFKNSQAIVNKLVTSLSAEISFDARGQRPRTKVPEKAFVAPKQADLKKHVDVVNRLYHNSLELDAAEALVKQAFAGNKKQPAALKAIQELRESVNDTLNDAFDSLSEIAEKHLPTGMTKFVDDVVSYVLDILDPKSFKNMFRQVYVTYDHEDHSILHFSQYLGIESLKTTSGFTFDQYYFVITGVITKAGVMTYYLNSFPDFKVPGKYPLGKEVATVNEAKKRISLLLAHNDFAVTGDKLPMPIDSNRAETTGITSIRGVESAKVVDDELIVTLTPTIKTENGVQKVVLDVMARLNAIVNSRTSSKIFTYKVSTVKGKRTVKFILVPNSDKSTKHMNLEKLDEAALLLGLDDKQKKALRFALQS